MVPAAQVDVEVGPNDMTENRVEATEFADASVAEVASPAAKPLTVPVAKTRMFVMDNAKFFLTIGVVGTHLGGPFIGNVGFYSYYQAATFVFLMPVYACISGYCSSPDLSNVKKIDGVIKVIAIYILAQTFYLILIRYVTPLMPGSLWGSILYACNGPRFTNANFPDGAYWKLGDWLSPFFQLWYLFDLAVWRLMLPFWSRLRYPLLAAVLWGPFVATFWKSGDPWETIFGYWPLYILGVQAKQHKWNFLKPEVKYRLVGFVLVCATSLLPVLVRAFTMDERTGPMNINGEIWHYAGALQDFCYGDGYKCMSITYLVRLLVPGVQLIAVWGFLHVIPHGEVRIISSYGERSLANYIFHPVSGFVVSWVGVYGSNGGQPFAKCTGPYGIPSWGPVVLGLFIILQSLFWMSPWVWKVVRPICDPPIQWILQPPRKPLESA